MIYTVGVSSKYQTILSCFYLSKSTSKDDYSRAVETTQVLFGGLQVEVIMIDSGLALMNAIRMNILQCPTAFFVICLYG